MNKLKIISICALSVFCIGIANAQVGRLQNQLSRPAPQKKNTVITCEIKKDSEKVKTELSARGVLKTEVKNKTVIIVISDSAQEVSLLIDTVEVNLDGIKKRLENKGYILLIPEPVEEKAVEAKPQIPAEKYKPEIDKFLNREDVLIFKENFMDLQDNQIHPSRQNRYQLIKEIYILNNYLVNVERTLANANVEEIARERNLPKETVKSILLESVKKDMDKADKQFDKIIPLAKEIAFLSLPQKQYYESLKNKFNDLNYQVNPNSQ